MRTIKPWMVLYAALVSTTAAAQYVTVDADLILRPAPDWSQTRNVLAINPTKKLPNMTFDQPYPSVWTNVEASLMDGLVINVQNIGDNEAFVDLRWSNPGILIYDIVLTDGKCFGVNWRLPQGGWRVQGRVVYNPAQNSIGWQDFSFINEAIGSATVNLGDCNISIARMEQLTQDLMNQTINPNWMEPLLRRAVLEWTTVKRGMGSALLETISYPLTDCVSLTWTPSEVRPLANGMWRIPGRFSLHSTSHNYDFGLVSRTENDSSLNSITTNSLVLPLNAVEVVAAATARNRGFHGFIPGLENPMFQKLFSNRKTQGFEWADLKRLPLDPQILFHAAVHGPVALWDRKASPTGLNYAHKSSVLVTAKTFALNQWWPYFDFKGIDEGRVALSVKDSRVALDLSFKTMDLRSYPRDEFLQVRAIEPFTNMDRLNPRFDKLLTQHQFSFPLPRWQVGNGLEIVAAGINESPASVRMPLTIVPISGSATIAPSVSILDHP